MNAIFSSFEQLKSYKISYSKKAVTSATNYTKQVCQYLKKGWILRRIQNFDLSPFKHSSAALK